MLTTFDLDDYVYEALRAGASGFLLKDTTPDQLVAAIHGVLDEDTLLAPTITRRLVERFAASRVESPARDARVAELTHREREILGHIARGRSNHEIADDLFLSLPTVKTHVGRIFSKLGVRDRVAAVIFAYETGLVRAGRLD